MTSTTGEVLLTLRGRGHPAIRASHGKTLELTRDASVTARGTCVVAVAAECDPPGGAVIAGPVRLRLSAGETQAVVHAVASPCWRPEDGIVVRRSPNRLPGTLATDADLAAAGLPQHLTALLRDPGQELRVVVERAGHRPDGLASLVLLALTDDPGQRPLLLAEAAAADLVIAEDNRSAALLRGAGISAVPASTGRRDARTTPPAGRTARQPGQGPPPRSLPPPAPTAEDVAQRGGRVLSVACEDLPGRALPGLLAAPAGVAVEVAGLPPVLAAAAASPSRAPVLICEERGRLGRECAAAAPGHTRLVFTTEAAALPGMCRAATATRPTPAVTLVAAAGCASQRVLRGTPEALAAALPARELVTCCLDPAPAPSRPAQDQLQRLLTALLRQHVPAKTLVSALTQLPGWSRNEAYRLVTGGDADGPGIGSGPGRGGAW